MKYCRFFGAFIVFCVLYLYIYNFFYIIYLMSYSLFQFK